MKNFAPFSMTYSHRDFPRIDGAVPDRIISLLQRHDQREEAVFILLYPAGDKDSSERIEEIRGSYRKTFVQQSVLRVDGESCVDF